MKKQRKATLKIQDQNNQLSKNKIEISQLAAEVQQKNALLQEQLRLKHQEIIDYTVARGKRNREIKEVSKTVDHLIDKGQANIIDLKTLKQQQDQLTNENNDFDLKQKIESIYPNFHENLRLKHPHLSKGDLRHCAFVLIDLSTRQVSELLFVAPKTVESARYRAKQKMGLGTTENLRTYLLSIQ